MDRNPFAPALEDLPAALPVFPLEGVLLLPAGHLPLNIFEPRYLAMVEDALAGGRLIGMVQPRKDGTLYEVGCAGKITEFTELPDGRFLIALTGVCRFGIERECESSTPYRVVKPLWMPYHRDLQPKQCLDIDREKLTALLERFFSVHEMNCDWAAIKDTPDGKLMTCLSMVCPLTPQEKQALLEAPCCKSRAQIFVAMLEMAVKARTDCGSCH